MQKIIKGMTIIAIMAVIMVSVTTVYATTPRTFDRGIRAGTEFDVLAEQVFGVLNAVGSVLAIAILAIIGLKYMLGSVEERATYKKSLVPYIIGAIIFFTAPRIAHVVYMFIFKLR